MYSPLRRSPLDQLMDDILQRIRLCANETVNTPNVMLEFTQSLYLLNVTVRHLGFKRSNFSIMYANSSGHRVPYMTVDGVSVRLVYNYIV